MEQLTSKIDSELRNSYIKAIGKNNNLIAGSITVGDDIYCDCKELSIKSESDKGYNNFLTKMVSGSSSHCHEGKTDGCNICDDINNCKSIDNLILCETVFDSVITGGSKKRKMSKNDCADDATSTINTEANKILNFIYNKYPEVEKGSVLTEVMFTNALRNLHLNIIHTDMPKAFEVVLAKHKRGSKRSDPQHPLQYIICHMKDLINPLITFEKSIEGYSYSELSNNLRYQSVNYDHTLLQRMPLKFDVSNMTHPIFVGLFWRRLPHFEHMCVESDQFQLLKNIHTKLDSIKPSNYNFDLATARWNEKVPVAFFGITNIVDTEIKRVMCHIYLKKVIYKLRIGDLTSTDSNKLISWMKKIFVFNSYDRLDDAEQLMTAFCNLFLVAPIKIYVQDQLACNPSYGIVVNSAIEDSMKSCPMIHAETVSGYGVTSGSLPNDLSCLRYDKIKNRAVLNLGGNSTRQLIPTGTCQPALSANGILPIFTRRKMVAGHRDLNTSIDMDDQLEHINISYLQIPPSYTIDNKTFNLSVAICYEVIQSDAGDRGIAAGYCSFVKNDDNRWFKYSSNSVVGATSVNYLRKKFIDSRNVDAYFTRVEMGDDVALEKKTEKELGDIFDRQYAQGIINAESLMISNDEAMEEIQKCSAFLIYSEDYDIYKNSQIRMRF